MEFGNTKLEFKKAIRLMGIANKRTGIRSLLILIPEDLIAVISLSAESLPKQTRIPSRVAIGIEKRKILGRMQIKSIPTSLNVRLS